MNLRLTCAAAILFAAFCAQAQSQDAHWVGSWSTAPIQTTATGATVTLGAPPAPTIATPPPTPPRSVPDAVNGAGRNTPPGGTAAMPVVPPRPPALGTQDITLRQTVHLSLGGSAIRVVLTNEYGTEPLTIGEAGISNNKGEAKLTFGGKPSITIPPGAIVLSDAIPLEIPSQSDLNIYTFVPAQTITYLTRHTGALQTNSLYQTNGSIVGSFLTEHERLRKGIGFSITMPISTPIYSWTFLKSVDVLAPANAAAVVAFGDSITDGAAATRDKNARWPDDLARRLQADPRTRNLAVLNEGIGGNRVLHDNTGPSALARFTRDALDQAGVKYIVVLEAINDIGNAYRTSPAPKDIVSADDLIQGYEQLIARAHLKGIKVIFATLTPYEGAGYASPDGEKVRETLNQWMRTNKDADGFVDFAQATSDPAHPNAFLPAYDSHDHLHPNDDGLNAMANAFDLTLFTK